MQIRAVAIGGITQRLAALELGSAGSFAGFLAAARNGRGLVFHVTELSSQRQTRFFRIDLQGVHYAPATW